jgi:adenosylmethionine---8-amino-7-oxononanoate aminotransferase
VPFPATFEAGTDIEIREKQALQVIERLLEQRRDRYAGIFIEPLIQGAGGMRMCRPRFLQALETLVREFNVLLIYDEVMTGFGRTGELFACLKSQTTPDLICLSKGLSGGCLPLAVTVATEAIYQAFYSDDSRKAFFHSHSYTGNPLACATGVASLDLLEQHPNGYQQLEALHKQYLEHYLRDCPKVENLRVCGTIAAMEIKTGTGGYFDTISPLLKARFLDHGLLMRPLGNTLYVMPPYVITSEQLQRVYQIMRQVLDSL